MTREHRDQVRGRAARAAAQREPLAGRLLRREREALVRGDESYRTEIDFHDAPFEASARKHLHAVLRDGMIDPHETADIFN